MKTHRIELLEPRIAPAAVLINIATKTASWTDWDGDIVTLRYTSATAPAFSTIDKGAGLLVDKISMAAQAFANSSVTISIKAAGGGDGHLDLGRVDASGIALKSWSSPAATIAEFDCGDGAKAVGTFVSGTLGAVPYTKFDNSGGNGTSYFKGAVTALTVLGDVQSTYLNIGEATGKAQSVTVTGDVNGAVPGAMGDQYGTIRVYATSTGALTIGGSVIGGSDPQQGAVYVDSPSIGSVKIKGSIIGGASTKSGVCYVQGTASSVSISGSITGGFGTESGQLYLADLVKTLSVGGNVSGGAGPESGVIIASSAKVNTLTIGGSIVGSTAHATGFVAVGSADSVTVKGSILGGQGTNASANVFTGGLLVDVDLKTLVVGGDLVGGTYSSGTKIGYNGAILVGGNLGSATIKGSILGHDGYQAIVMAGGKAPATPGNYNAIGKLAVGGNVSFGYIAAGHTLDNGDFAERIGAAENPDAGIGSVTVGGNWFHSNLGSGINDATTNGLTSSDTHDAGLADRQAVIGPVVIKGYALDNPNAATFGGFVAEKIARITVHGTTVFKSGDATKSLDSFNFVDIAEI